MALAGDHLQILVGGYELTGDYNQVQIADARAMLEQTSFGDNVHNFAPGQIYFCAQRVKPGKSDSLFI